MADTRFASLQGRKYLNIETFRKNGQGVRTPVWFAEEPENGAAEKLYVYSTSDSGKAKRIRNNGRVRVAPCDVRGKLLGEWVGTRAEDVNGPEAEHVMNALNKKDMPRNTLLDFLYFFSP